MELPVSTGQRTGRLRRRHVRLARHLVMSDPVDGFYDSDGEAILTHTGFTGVTVEHLEVQVLLSRVLDPQRPAPMHRTISAVGGVDRQLRERDRRGMEVEWRPVDPHLRRWSTHSRAPLSATQTPF